MVSASPRVGLAALAALTVLLSASASSAYCRTASCGDAGTGARCTPAEPADCGVPLFWKSGCPGWSLQRDASKWANLATVESIVAKSFATWMGAACTPGSTPQLVGRELTNVCCTKREYNSANGNANVIVFRDASWPYEGSSNTLALTTVTYALDTGEIYDADIELNSFDARFTTTDTAVGFDLQSIVTHEVGHFLGLAHVRLAAATMYPDYVAGSVALRKLGTDDVAGVCAIYPPSGPEVDATCDATPRHGFSTSCSGDTVACDIPVPDDGKGCAVAPIVRPGSQGSAAGSAARAAGLGGLLALVAALALRSRRRG